MIIINIDIAVSKTDTIIFEIAIAFVSNLAHPCGILLQEIFINRTLKALHSWPYKHENIAQRYNIEVSKQMRHPNYLC
jgi:hypothetical protein